MATEIKLAMGSLTVGEMAARLGVHPQTLRRWGREGHLPETSRTSGNHRRYEVKAPEKSGACLGYARVSSHDQKNDLKTQEEAIRSESAKAGHPVCDVITDIGSGMNTKKRGFLKLVGMILAGKVRHLVLLHRDRLLRFGADLVFLVCRTMGVRVTILHDTPDRSPMEQLAGDLVEIIETNGVFSSKLYGMRSHQNRQRRDAQVCATLPATA